MSPTVSTKTVRNQKGRRTSTSPKLSWWMSWTHFSTRCRSLSRGQPKILYSCGMKSTQGTRTAPGQLSSNGRPQGQEASANSVSDDEAYHRTDHRRHTRKHSRPRWDRPVPSKDWHSENSRQCSQHSQRRETRSREDHSDVQGQTRQHSKLINRLEVEQI